MAERMRCRPALEGELAEMVSPVLEAMGFELVLVRLTGGVARPNVQIMAEHADGGVMGVEDCARISRALDAVLDHADLLGGGWRLEVSSPGIDRPLVRIKDWRRARGRLARVELAQPIDGRRRFSGLIVGLEEQAVRLGLEGGSEVVLPLAAVRRARLVLTPELLADHEPATGSN